MLTVPVEFDGWAMQIIRELVKMMGLHEKKVHFINEALAGITGYTHFAQDRISEQIENLKRPMQIGLADIGSRSNDCTLMQVSKSGPKLEVVIHDFK